MPLKPGSIKLHQLDTAIQDAVKNFSVGKLEVGKTPIVNGIILNEDALGDLDVNALAKQLTATVPKIDNVKLTSLVEKLGDGRVLLGFKIRSL